MKIIGAKININENIFKENYKELIPFIGEAIKNNNDKKVQYYKSSWTFGDISEIQYKNCKIIKGKIYKLKPNTKDKEWDDELRKPVPSKATLAFESNFIFNISSEVIIFEENKEISRYAFGTVFSKLCGTIDYRIGTLKLKTVPRQIELEKYFKEYNKIFRAEFIIIPANLDSDKIFSDVDKQLKKDEVEDFKMVLYNEKGNINTKEGSMFNSCLKFVNSGYGHAILTFGKYVNKKRKTKRVKTDNHVHCDETLPENFEKSATELLDIVEKSIKDNKR